MAVFAAAVVLDAAPALPLVHFNDIPCGNIEASPMLRLIILKARLIAETLPKKTIAARIALAALLAKGYAL